MEKECGSVVGKRWYKICLTAKMRVNNNIRISCMEAQTSFISS